MKLFKQEYIDADIVGKNIERLRKEQSIKKEFIAKILLTKTKGVNDMSEKKNVENKKENKAKKPLTKAGDIKGKLEVPDTRERKDGPGGN